MRVTIRLFARLADIAGRREWSTDLLNDSNTIGTVWSGLVREFPELAAYERTISAARNADYSRMDQTVHDGDEIAFLPPVSGG